MKKEKLPDLALIDEQYQKQKVENALLNFSLENATLGLDNDDDLYNQKKRVLSMIDNVNRTNPLSNRTRNYAKKCFRC